MTQHRTGTLDYAPFLNEGAKARAPRSLWARRMAARRVIYRRFGVLAAAMHIRAVAEMGATLGMEVVAEGLETLEQVEAVREAGCTLGKAIISAARYPNTAH